MRYGFAKGQDYQKADRTLLSGKVLAYNFLHQKICRHYGKPYNPSETFF